MDSSTAHSHTKPRVRAHGLVDLLFDVADVRVEIVCEGLSNRDGHGLQHTEGALILPARSRERYTHGPLLKSEPPEQRISEGSEEHQQRNQQTRGETLNP